MTQVLVLGSVSWNTMIYVDKFPEPRSQTLFSKGFHETVGSAGAGKALNLHKLGMAVTLHGLIGDDLQGTAVKTYFQNEHLPFIYDLDPQGTQRHVNLMNAAGGRISIFIAYGSSEPQVDTEHIGTLMHKSDYVVINIANYCRHLFPLAKHQNKAIWCDIQDYDGTNPYHQDFITGADYLFMSSEALSDYRAVMEKFMRQVKKLVVCTHGKSGSTALTPEGQWIETPIAPGYETRDTNGAGDAFFSGVLYGFTRSYPLDKCLKLGAIVGGLCVTSRELAAPELSPDLLEAEYRRLFGS